MTPPKILDCTWTDQATKDDVTEVAHYTQAECLNHRRGWRFDPIHFENRLRHRNPHGRVFYPNIERNPNVPGLGNVVFSDDHLMLTELSRWWAHSPLRGTPAFAAWPLYTSWANLCDPSDAAFQKWYYSEPEGFVGNELFVQSWIYMGGYGAPLYRDDETLDRWKIRAAELARRVRIAAGDLPIYVVTGCRTKAAKETPWVDEAEFIEQARFAVDVLEASAVIFGQEDNAEDGARQKAMVAAAKAALAAA